MPPARRARPPVETVDLTTASAVLALGAEDFLADRVVAEVLAAARAADPDTERRVIDLGQDRAAGELTEALSPNLFGDAAVVVARGAESADPSVVDVLVAAITDGLAQDVRLVVVHPGGVKGRGVADRLRKAGIAVVACERPKGRALDDLVAGELRSRGRRATPEAIGSLRAALGDDLRLLVAAVDQLCADVEGDLDEAAVATYYDGVADVPGYLISDAVWD